MIMTESKKIKQRKAKAEIKMRRWAGRRVKALAIGAIVCSAALVFAERAYNWRSSEVVSRVKPAAAEPILQGQPATRCLKVDLISTPTVRKGVFRRNYL